MLQIWLYVTSDCFIWFIDNNQYYYEETEEDNIIEPEAPITTRRPDTHTHTRSTTVVSTEQMCKLVLSQNECKM